MRILFRSAVVVASLLLVSAAVARADPVPIADVSQSADTDDGWHVTASLSKMTVNSVPNMAATYVVTTYMLPRMADPARRDRAQAGEAAPVGRPGALRPDLELLEGSHCPLAARGYSNKGNPQVNWRLLADRQGCGKRGNCESRLPDRDAHDDAPFKTS